MGRKLMLNAETMSENTETPPAYEDAKAAEAAKSEQGAGDQKAPGTMTAAKATIVTQPVVTQQPQMVMMQTVQLRPWSKSICQCDCANCCYATWCSCMVGKNVAELIGDDGTMWCCLYACCCCWTPFFICSQRSTMRQRFQIQGDAINDFIMGWFCTCCALAQMQNEVNVLRSRMVVQPVVMQQPQ